MNGQELSTLDKCSGSALVMCCKALVRPVARVEDHCIVSKEWEAREDLSKEEWFIGLCLILEKLENE